MKKTFYPLKYKEPFYLPLVFIVRQEGKEESFKPPQDKKRQPWKYNTFEKPLMRAKDSDKEILIYNIG